MTIPSRIAGGLSLISCISDIHKTAVLYSNKGYSEASSDTFIAQSIGSQKTNCISYKDANRKNWLRKQQFTNGISEAWGRTKGYFQGLAQGVVRYLPNFILSAVAIIPKSTSRYGKVAANLAAVGLAGLEVFDFIKNSTNVFQRTDYLK